jgi:hypothetical protein
MPWSIQIPAQFDPETYVQKHRLDSGFGADVFPMGGRILA